MKKVMVVYGTRPEAIKIAPLIRAINESSVLAPVVVSTGQHREMLEQVSSWFGIKNDADLRVMRPGQSLNELSARIFNSLPTVIEEHRPDAVVVQGDTTTVAVAALACFYADVPVVHLEAGLRSGDISSPYPEEGNRRVAGQIAALHLAPTPQARENLLAERVAENSISVVGNTVIDALAWTARKSVAFHDHKLQDILASGRDMVLVTSHRRENWGGPMERIAAAVGELAKRYPDTHFVFPVHRNPLVRQSISPTLSARDNVLLGEPLEYPEFVHAMKHAKLVLTDSGGVQEEAPSLGKPVLVLRDNTERPEAVQAGTVKLVGTRVDSIVEEACRLLDDDDAYAGMSNAINPYGDGRAAERSVAAISQLLGVGLRMPEFRG